MSENSEHVYARYTKKAIAHETSFALIPLTEEELFTHFDTAILKGTVTKLDNLVLNFNGEKVYRAIAQIHVEAVYRGNCKTGETVSVLLPCPIQEGVWVEDTETISAIQLGMTGIFMPIQ